VAAHARQRHDHAANELLLPLIRSGITELPASALESAADERRLEEMANDGLFGDDDPGDAVTAVRHFVARRIEARLRAPDDGAALWPGEPEPYNVSWQRFFDIAWPRWETAALLDALHERLASRASKADAAERDFALHVLHQALVRGDLRAEALGNALEQGGYEADKLDQVRTLARLGRLQLGWKLFKDKRYPEARRVADAALADAPNDGQVRFFDARLAWLEHDDPKQAIARIPGALDKATDGIGRGRLYNLYGAALDALGDVAGSIAWFEKGFAADPSQAAMFLSNIAEAHWKLGNRDEAARFANKAAQRGATTDIVNEILDATGGGDDEAEPDDDGAELDDDDTDIDETEAEDEDEDE
jgi:tetratricopeptide (TPR) repeat protein